MREDVQVGRWLYKSRGKNMKHIVLLFSLMALSGIAGFSLGRAGTSDLDTKVDQIDRNLRVLADAVGVDLGSDDLVSIDLLDSPVRGPSDAPITVVEFSDFQCGYCRKVHPVLMKIQEYYADQVKIVFKHFPLSFHKKALIAHRAAIAAQDQGKFWEMHDLIFNTSEDLSRSAMIKHAKSLNLDTSRFKDSLDSKNAEALIDRDMSLGREVGVTGTPAFFINGRKLVGAQPFSVFKEAIEGALTESS